MNAIINMEKKMLLEGKCCISGKPLKDCKQLNWIQLQVKATWSFPVWGNFITGEKNMAIAYVHDDCCKDDLVVGEIIHAVEFKGNEIIYHPLKELR